MDIASMLTPPLKLNLGSGIKRIDGFLNVDHSAECNPDIVLDLETFPWSFNSNSVVHVVMNHSMEHVGQTPEKFLQIMQELYRVCRHDAVLDITVPNPSHDSFTADPTHVRPILPLTLALFDRQKIWTGARRRRPTRRSRFSATSTSGFPSSNSGSPRTRRRTWWNSASATRFSQTCS